MSKFSTTLLTEIEAFLSDTEMSPSYFGKKAVGNSELVSRLQKGRRIWPDTEWKVRLFIETERKRRAVAA